MNVFRHPRQRILIPVILLPVLFSAGCHALSKTPEERRASALEQKKRELTERFEFFRPTNIDSVKIEQEVKGSDSPATRSVTEIRKQGGTYYYRETREGMPAEIFSVEKGRVYVKGNVPQDQKWKDAFFVKKTSPDGTNLPITRLQQENTLFTHFLLIDPLRELVSVEKTPSSELFFQGNACSGLELSFCTEYGTITVTVYYDEPTSALLGYEYAPDRLFPDRKMQCAFPSSETVRIGDKRFPKTYVYTIPGLPGRYVTTIVSVEENPEPDFPAFPRDTHPSESSSPDQESQLSK